MDDLAADQLHEEIDVDEESLQPETPPEPDEERLASEADRILDETDLHGRQPLE